MATTTVATRKTRRVYSAEQLHRLRGTVSQPKLHESIEEQHDGEDAELVKEHVLRGSKSFAARSWKPRNSANSLRVPLHKENRSTHASDSDRPSFTQQAIALAPVLGEIAANNQQISRVGGLPRSRRSPTPSLKRKKVEAIVKAHGSPTHVRVTAGGRIVPSEQSPLCHPRYGYSAIKTNGGLVKFAPNHPMGKSQWTQATQNGFVAQDVNGRLCQIVDGTIMPLKEIEGALQLYMPAPNLNVTQRGASSVAHAEVRITPVAQQPVVPPAARPVPPEPSVPAQINALELEYSKLNHELKDVDKTEVLHGRTMGKAAKDALVCKRRELVMTLDNVRKALKSLKQQGIPPNAPTSPRAMQTRQPGSPPRNRLPAFLQQRQQHEMPPPPAPQAVYGAFFGQQPPFAGPYAFQPAPSPDSTYSGVPWAMPPPAMFVPPPPFDGSMSVTSLAVPDTLNVVLPVQQAQTKAAADTKLGQADMPQNDGSRSAADLHKISPPRQSHAVPIRLPELKAAVNVKSNLNPMSPEYRPSGASSTKSNTPAEKPFATKPAKDRAPTPMSSVHQAQPVGRSPLRAVNTTGETISPSKKTAHLHSSSVSSFETADFFPRNTREYSTRQHNYATEDSSEEKENSAPQQSQTAPIASPNQAIQQQSTRSAAPETSTRASPSVAGYEIPAAPPGTPVNRDEISGPAPLQLKVDDRNAHNLSPKTKRHEWLFVEEHPEGDQTIDPTSSPAKDRARRDELCVTSSPQDTMDFSKKSRDWIEGYQAGLNRHPVGAQRIGEFLDGYCSGLLKSSPANIGPSTGSPVKSTSRRPSPVPVQPRPAERRAGHPALSPLETKLRSLDTLKQAVFAPQNENTILTPAADGSHVNEPPFHLGSWTKDRAVPPAVNKPLPPAGSSSENHGSVENHRDSAVSVPMLQIQRSENQVSQQPSSPTMSAKSLAPSSIMSEAHRVSSITSVDSKLYRQWPGSRVVSPSLEWKSASSVGHQTGLATGFFAHAQFDGAPQAQKPGAAAPTTHSAAGAKIQVTRFREASIDGVTNSASSPPPMSPPMSPRMSPAKKGSNNSPNKGPSPARAKFEHIAEKVGINVSSQNDTNSPPGGPGGKRRWRDVWRGSRKDGSKDN